MSYCDFSKVCENKKAEDRKYEEHKTNFDDTYLCDGWKDSTEI